MRSVDVYFNDDFAGTLTEISQTEYQFCYNDIYFNDINKKGIITLPKTQKKHTSTSIFPLFTNMLPEGANRKVVCRLFKVDENDFFGLLMAMRGADFIGAINIR